MSVSQTKRNLPRIEWDFSGVPDSELLGCLYYEYARESAYIVDVYTRCHESMQEGKGDPDGTLNRELVRMQSIHPYEDVFISGFTHPRPNEPQGERHEFAPPLTSCFPDPWQTIGEDERKYRANIHQWYEDLAPIERAHWSDAKDILEQAEYWKAHVFDYEKRYGVSRAEACKACDLPETPRSSFYRNGEILLLTIRWELYTNDQLVAVFREWVKTNRPKGQPPPDYRGRKPKDTRAALKRLGIMRLLHTYTVAEIPRLCPEAARLMVAPDCYKERKRVPPLFHKLFPFLSVTDNPISWSTRGGARTTPKTPRRIKPTE